jgi:hypothetical protein
LTITNFLDSYEEYAKNTVAIPQIFHKWAAIMAVGVSLGRRVWIERGHFKVFPNLYVLLVGEPGTGKGVACSLLQDILQKSGYEYFAADRSSKEKFLQDLADGIDFNRGSMEGLLENELFDDAKESGNDEPKECFALAEELQDFLGQNNMDFIAFLTKVWSQSGPYRYRIKTGRSVVISDPCINILGGTTSSNFALTFPPEVSSQGFLARLILVSGEFTGVRETWPPPINQELRDSLANFLGGISHELTGGISLSRELYLGLDELNKEFGGIDDPRFKDYNSRRFTQLLKLITINAAARGSLTLSIEDIERADELLRETERWMSKALGSFGKAKNADIANKVIQYLHTVTKPATVKELWKLVCDDLDKFSDIGDLLGKLVASERIQNVGGGYLPKLKAPEKKLELIKVRKEGGEK